MARTPLPSSRAGLQLAIDDACVVFALHRESRPFFGDFHPHQTFPGAPVFAKLCGPSWLPVVAVETGVGQARTERALNWLLAEPAIDDLPYKPKLILAAGFCGGLHDDLHCGDIVLATEVIDAATGERFSTTWPGELPVGRWDPPLHRGRMVTVPRLVATPEQKRSLHTEWDALAVDMESAAAARACREAEVPFGCLRVVLDDAVSPLSPKFVALLSSANASPWRLAGAVASAPGLTPELIQLARRSRFAALQLGRALGEVLTLTLPWMQD